LQNVIVADNRVAALAAVAKASELGLNPLLLSTFIEGEAREIARSLAGMAKEVLTYSTPLARPACLLVGGETTVTVRGSGKGGRNQELALAAALALAGYTDFIVLALATDGTDGPTDAAGAICDAATLAQAQALDLDAHAFLKNNDAYHFFEQLGDLLITGPTNTNVNDLTMLFCF
jgi:hydroxypyruvate reductase